MLSVVATSRNDDHGGNVLERTQHFVNGLYAQAERHKFPIELILVDWNPPADKPLLYEALHWPKEQSRYFSYRVIEVPFDHHVQFENSDRLPLFQYIAKNIGIRRANGQSILATNIDILFSDKLIKFLKDNKTQQKVVRVDRFDIQPDLPSAAEFEEILEYAKNNVLRVHTIGGTISYFLYQNIKHNFYKIFKINLAVRYFYKIICSFIKNSFRKLAKIRMSDLSFKDIHLFFKLLWRSFKSFVCEVIFFCSGNVLHTNACGDFTLMTRDNWVKLKGYPEWPIYSWHIDSVLLYQARLNGISSINLPPDHNIYHIEHGAGSGWTPQHAWMLFERLKKNNIPYLTDQDLKQEVFHMSQLKEQKKDITYNTDNWGAAAVVFKERGCSALC